MQTVFIIFCFHYLCFCTRLVYNEISFLEGRPEAKYFAELCKDLTIWHKEDPMTMVANMVLPMYELLTGNSAVEGGEVKFSIPDKQKEIEEQIKVLKQNEKGNEALRRYESPLVIFQSPNRLISRRSV